jgi:hypothetical protein
LVLFLPQRFENETLTFPKNMTLSPFAQSVRGRFRKENSEWAKKYDKYAEKPMYPIEDLSLVQWNALGAMKQHGDLIGYMVGSVGWKWEWVNNVNSPTPKTSTMKSLQRRNLVYQMRRDDHAKENGYIKFTLDYDKSVYG